jgi:hypothetical protein
MNSEQSSCGNQLPAPCLIDIGVVVNKRDIQRLLTDLTRVRYVYSQDGIVTREGEGCIVEVFSDPSQSTLIANHSLYLNVSSFDYLEMGRSPEQDAWFDLFQDGRLLRLIPLTNPLTEHYDRRLNASALEAMVAEVLSANWDVQIDDEEHFSF